MFILGLNTYSCVKLFHSFDIKKLAFLNHKHIFFLWPHPHGMFTLIWEYQKLFFPILCVYVVGTSMSLLFQQSAVPIF